MKTPEKSLEYLVEISIEVLSISREQAKLRVAALVKSGVLDIFDSPDDPAFQFAVDIAMKIPQLKS